MIMPSRSLTIDAAAVVLPEPASPKYRAFANSSCSSSATSFATDSLLVHSWSIWSGDRARPSLGVVDGVRTRCPQPEPGSCVTHPGLPTTVGPTGFEPATSCAHPLAGAPGAGALPTELRSLLCGVPSYSRAFTSTDRTRSNRRDTERVTSAHVRPRAVSSYAGVAVSSGAGSNHRTRTFPKAAATPCVPGTGIEPVLRA